MSTLRVCFISDTHTYHKSVEIPECDILIHSGDATYRGLKDEMESFGQWFRELPVKHKVFVPGNHDKSTEFDLANALSWLSFNNDLKQFGECYYLHQNWAIIEGMVIYGDGSQPRFGHGWAHNVDRGEPIAEVWAKIVDNVNILVTHGPVHGVLDLTFYGQESVGCEELKKRIGQLDNMFIHSCGHIHEAYGTSRKGDKLYVNASICTLQYNPTNKPILVDVWQDDLSKWRFRVVK